MIDFLAGVPGKLKTLLDRLSATWAAKVDTLHDTRLTATRAGYLDRLDATVTSRNYGTRCTTLTSGSGNWTVPDDVSAIEFWMCGGGGGGGIGAGTGSYSGTGGGGGGGGEIVFGRMAVTAGGSLSYTVGAGGGSATNGGDTTLGTLTAYGGEAGSNGSASNSTHSAGAAGGSSPREASGVIGRVLVNGAGNATSSDAAKVGGELYRSLMLATTNLVSVSDGTSSAAIATAGWFAAPALGLMTRLPSGSGGGSAGSGATDRVGGAGGASVFTGLAAAGGSGSGSSRSGGGGGGGCLTAGGNGGATGTSTGGTGGSPAANTGAGGGGGGGALGGTNGPGGAGGSGVIYIFYSSRA